MKRVRSCSLRVGAVASATPTLAQQVRVLSGQTGSNAHYRIESRPSGMVDLVIWNHGFDLNPPGPVGHDDLGPLADVQLAQGYAVAASATVSTGGRPSRRRPISRTSTTSSGGRSALRAR